MNKTECLRQYRLLFKHIEKEAEALKNFEQIDYKTPGAFSCVNGIGSRTIYRTSVVEKSALMFVNMCNHIERDLLLLFKLGGFLIPEINKLDSIREQIILEEYYLNNKTIEQIAQSLCLSVETIKQIKAIALRNLETNLSC